MSIQSEMDHIKVRILAEDNNQLRTTIITNNEDKMKMYLKGLKDGENKTTFRGGVLIVGIFVFDYLL